MKVSELRIGNFVLMSGTIVHMDVKLFHAVIHGFNGYNPEPIPLTEKWLIVFGCESKSVNRYPDNKLVEYVSLEKINPSSDYGSGFEFKKGCL